jgi:hypothetical protein
MPRRFVGRIIAPARQAGPVTGGPEIFSRSRGRWRAGPCGPAHRHRLGRGVMPLKSRKTMGPKSRSMASSLSRSGRSGPAHRSALSRERYALSSGEAVCLARGCLTRALSRGQRRKASIQDRAGQARPAVSSSRTYRTGLSGHTGQLRVAADRRGGGTWGRVILMFGGCRRPVW